MNDTVINKPGDRTTQVAPKEAAKPLDLNALYFSVNTLDLPADAGGAYTLSNDPLARSFDAAVHGVTAKLTSDLRTTLTFKDAQTPESAKAAFEKLGQANSARAEMAEHLGKAHEIVKDLYQRDSAAKSDREPVAFLTSKIVELAGIVTSAIGSIFNDLGENNKSRQAAVASYTDAAQKGAELGRAILKRLDDLPAALEERAKLQGPILAYREELIRNGLLVEDQRAETVSIFPKAYPGGNVTHTAFGVVTEPLPRPEKAEPRTVQPIDTAEANGRERKISSQLVHEVQGRFTSQELLALNEGLKQRAALEESYLATIAERFTLEDRLSNTSMLRLMKRALISRAIARCDETIKDLSVQTNDHETVIGRVAHRIQEQFKGRRYFDHSMLPEGLRYAGFPAGKANELPAPETVFNRIQQLSESRNAGSGQHNGHIRLAHSSTTPSRINDGIVLMRKNEAGVEEVLSVSRYLPGRMMLALNIGTGAGKRSYTETAWNDDALELAAAFIASTRAPELKAPRYKELIIAPAVVRTAAAAEVQNGQSDVRFVGEVQNRSAVRPPAAGTSNELPRTA